MRRQKPGPKPRPKRELKRHAVMVKFNDLEWQHVRATAPGPLASHLRTLAMAVPRMDAA